MKIKYTSEWEDDLIWCPSQLRKNFIFKYRALKLELQLYCRWRWDDPWQIAILGYNSSNPADWGGLNLYHEFAWGMSENDKIEDVHAFAQKELNKYLKKNSKKLYLLIMKSKLKRV